MAWAVVRNKVELTFTEKEIIVLVCKGLRRKEIAEKQHIAVKTVENHLYRTYKKLGIRNRVQLFQWALSEGFI